MRTCLLQQNKIKKNQFLLVFFVTFIFVRIVVFLTQIVWTLIMNSDGWTARCATVLFLEPQLV